MTRFTHTRHACSHPILLLSALAVPTGECDGRKDTVRGARRKLAQTGAVALYPKDGGLQVQEARSIAGDRLWNRSGRAKPDSGNRLTAAVP